MTHYVYVIENERGPVKIGIAADPRKRVVQMKSSSPGKLTLAKVYEVNGDAQTLERAAQSHLFESRISGEWFDATVAEAADAIEHVAKRRGIAVSAIELSDLDSHVFRTEANFRLRISQRLHDALKHQAKVERISVNTLIVRALDARVKRDAAIFASQK